MNDRDKQLSNALDVLTVLRERLDDPTPITREEVRRELRLVRRYLEEGAMPPRSSIRSWIQRIKEAA